MPDKSSVCTISLPGGVHKRFEKRAAARFTMRFGDLGITPTSRIVSSDITMLRLPRLSERSNGAFYRLIVTAEKTMIFALSRFMEALIGLFPANAPIDIFMSFGIFIKVFSELFVYV